MSLPLDELRYLEALARLGSAARAARELGVASSTVYRKISALERALGVTCLSRGGGVTAAGLELATIARGARTSIADTVRRWREASDDVAGAVSLTTVSGFVPLIAGALEGLTARYPGLRVDLHVADDGPSVRDREVDIAISVLPSPPPELVGRRVMTIRYGVYALASLGPAPERWVVLGPPMQSTPQARWEAAHVDTARVAAATGSRAAFFELVRAGVGAGVLPKPLAARASELSLIPEHGETLSELDRPAWLLTHPELRHEARIRAVMDALEAALAEHP